MSEVLYDEIPSLDLHDFLSDDPDRKREFVRQVGEAYTNIGFLALKNHGLNDQLTEALYNTIQKFFDLPDQELTDLSQVIVLSSEDMEFGILANEILDVKKRLILFSVFVRSFAGGIIPNIIRFYKVIIFFCIIGTIVSCIS